MEKWFLLTGSKKGWIYLFLFLLFNTVLSPVYSIINDNAYGTEVAQDDFDEESNKESKKYSEEVSEFYFLNETPSLFSFTSYSNANRHYLDTFSNFCPEKDSPPPKLT